jgi:hypothetical protein
MATGYVAVVRATGHFVDGTGDTVVTTPRAQRGRIAGLGRGDYAVAAARGTVVVIIYVTSQWAATIAVGTTFYCLVTACDIAVTRAARHRINCTRGTVATACRAGALRVTCLTGFDHAVAAGCRTVIIIIRVTPRRAATVSVRALADRLMATDRVTVSRATG